MFRASSVLIHFLIYLYRCQHSYMMSYWQPTDTSRGTCVYLEFGYRTICTDHLGCLSWHLHVASRFCFNSVYARDMDLCIKRYSSDHYRDLLRNQYPFSIKKKVFVARHSL